MRTISGPINHCFMDIRCSYRVVVCLPLCLYYVSNPLLVLVECHVPDDQGYLGFNGFFYALRCQWWPGVSLSSFSLTTWLSLLRDEYSRCCGPGLFYRIADLGKYRLSKMRFSSFLGVCPTNDICA